ncbi:helix-turn-helix transcriptional regulator [Parabacteroides sp. APC149_11_2_Y6]
MLFETQGADLVVHSLLHPPEELRSFFHPMTDEQVPFKSLVLTHYRKANSTEELADLCGYGVHTFRRVFKSEFGTPVYRWLIQKRAEHIKYRLLQVYIPFVDIMDEFNFSSPQHFNSFCKKYLGDTPGNILTDMQPKLRE